MVSSTQSNLIVTQHINMVSVLAIYHISAFESLVIRFVSFLFPFLFTVPIPHWVRRSGKRSKNKPSYGPLFCNNSFCQHFLVTNNNDLMDLDFCLRSRIFFFLLKDHSRKEVITYRWTSSSSMLVPIGANVSIYLSNYLSCKMNSIHLELHQKLTYMSPPSIQLGVSLPNFICEFQIRK